MHIAVVNLFLSGMALPSFAPYMASASMVPLLKKDGKFGSCGRDPSSVSYQALC